MHTKQLNGNRNNVPVKALKGLWAGALIAELTHKKLVDHKDLYASSFSLPSQLKEKYSIAYRSVAEAFSADSSFANKLKISDEVIDAVIADGDFKELGLDCLFTEYYLNNSLKDSESFYESNEWQKIEALVSERGTQLIDCLLYLNELEPGQKPQLVEFLDNYLLLGEEAFDEEAAIYKDLNENRDILSLHPAEIFMAGENLEEDSFMKPFFVPVLYFFKSPEDPATNLKLLLEFNKADIFSLSVISILHASYAGTKAFPEFINEIITHE